MLDASARVEPGFTFGNNHWLGSYRDCKYAGQPLQVTLSPRYNISLKSNMMTDVAPFAVEFKVIYAEHFTPSQIRLEIFEDNILHIGLCLPKSCSTEEVFEMAQKFFEMTTIHPVHKINAKVLQVKDLKLREDFFWRKGFLIVRLVHSR